MKNLSIGQEIAYCTSGRYFTSTFIRFDYIKRVTKTGIISLEGGRRFNKYGNELKSACNPYPCSYLVDKGLAERRLNAERNRIRF